ncbi:MAG: AI-2E family transporter [Anaerolineae bacterium]|nr:AI-2E family transporter [Anaerolineae bacterium]
MTTGGTSLSLGAWTQRVFVTLLLIALFVGVWALREIFLMTFLAIILAIVLHIPVQRLQRLGLKRGLSIFVSLAGSILAVALLLVLIVPVFAVQVRSLIDDLPDSIDEAQATYDEQAAQQDWLPDIKWDDVTEGNVSDFLIEQASELPRNVFPFLSGIGGAITSTVFVFFITVFFITEPASYLEALLTLFPREYRPRALEIFEQLAAMLQRWFVGQLISMTMSGLAIAFVTGAILRLPNAAALGVISGIMEFVPNFGSIIAVIPAVIIALAKDPILVPFTILAYLLTQQVQSNVIMPRIMARQIQIPAASILIAQIIGAALFGFLGVLLALPLAIVVLVLVREVYVHDTLNAQAARVQTLPRADGTQYRRVTTDVYRPEALSPGEAALVRATGSDLFGGDRAQIVEIITPSSPALEQASRSQQAVWMAILALTVAQGVALVRSLVGGERT